MKTVAQYLSVIFLFMVLLAALRTIFERQRPFFRKLDKDTRESYMWLVIVAVGLIAWAHVDFRRIQSFEIGGMKATLTEVQERVDTLSDQVEELFKRKKLETFGKQNWDRVRTVKKSADGVVLEVTLEQEPIPGSIEVREGVLEMPEQDFQLEGRVLRFPANSDKGDNGLTIKYYPRLSNSNREPHDKITR